MRFYTRSVAVTGVVSMCTRGLSLVRFGSYGGLLVPLVLAGLGVLSGCKSAKSTLAPEYKPVGKGQTMSPNTTATQVIAPVGGPLQPERRRVFDLIHTRLELEPLWETKTMKGLAQIVLTSHFGRESLLELDAKSMEIRSVSRIYGKRSLPLKYTYDDRQIRITMDSAVTAGQRCTLEIDYTARPELIKSPQGGPIGDEKGLYFINADGKLPNRPRQLWTQGEVESSSVWFPTIDAPNQKTTEEILVTVDTSMTTLSNGVMVSSTKLAGGKRQDHWELNLPHAPYLFALVVGPFAVVKDNWRGKEVSYYVEKPYRATARTLFGRTPEMIEFFSKRLGVDYPWPKYSQAVVRDYVSGAMENTTATIHMEELMLDQASFPDRDWDNIIAHELFHHWFGDLATCESWSNLSLNESFANYSEYLWDEHHKGVDAADYTALEERLQYFYESRFKQEPLIRYRFNNPMEMFDGHSYAKGGRILHMLRGYLGDEAFFGGIQHYLKKFSFKKAEVHDLRLAFEEISGQDLNWFFDQWYFRPGHPQLAIRKTFTGDGLIFSVAQTQDTTYTPVYRLPFAIEVWNGDKHERLNFTLTERNGTFEIPMAKAPTMVQFDPDNVLLAEVRYDRPIEEMRLEFDRAPRALHRALALDKIVKLMPVREMNETMRRGLRDESHFVRTAALEAALGGGLDLDEQTRNMIADMARYDKNADVREEAVGLIGSLKIEPVEQRLGQILDQDKSYIVQAEALNQYVIAKGKDVDQRMRFLEGSPSPRVTRVIAELYAVQGLPDKLAFFQRRLHDFSKGNQAVIIKALGAYANNTTTETRAQALAILDGLRQYAPESPNIRASLKAAAKQLSDKEDTKALKERIGVL